jgi:hypothetical protein
VLKRTGPVPVNRVSGDKVKGGGVQPGSCGEPPSR